MSSNYDQPETVETVQKTVKCTTCHGSGQVEVDGWETDCIDCEGYGDYLVPV